jgi:nucleoside-diphosphate-sugar epimerase
MNILLTGASGFLGSHFPRKKNIITLGKMPINNIQCDLSKNIPITLDNINKVVHMAGIAHINPKNKDDEKKFHEINYIGTLNLIKSLVNHNIKQFIYISSVAVYGLNSGELINENHPLRPSTPYGKSKLETEKYLIDWATKRNINLLILRLPLVIGKNPPGNLGKMINSIKNGKYIAIKNNQAKKSVVLASDVVKICLSAMEMNGTYNLADSTNPTFEELENLIAKKLNKKIFFKIPSSILKYICLFGDKLPKSFPIKTSLYDKIVNPLTFDNKKALTELEWSPSNIFKSDWI